MNGELVQSRIGDSPLLNAAARIVMTAPSDEEAVEAAYLAILSRRPTVPEAAHFVGALKETEKDGRRQVVENLYWALINSTEFSWNH